MNRNPIPGEVIDLAPIGGAQSAVAAPQPTAVTLPGAQSAAAPQPTASPKPAFENDPILRSYEIHRLEYPELNQGDIEVASEK